MSMLAMLGMLGAGAMSSAAQVQTNQKNLENQLKTNVWQQELADSAHQREVVDLYRAGLNPILSASGSGSQVPSLGTANMQNPGQGLADGISSASNLMSSQYKAAVRHTNAQTDNINEDTSAKKVQQDLTRQQIQNEEIRQGILEQERGSALHSSINKRLQDAAIVEALTGKRPDELEHFVDWRDPSVRKTYDNLIHVYRNKVELERYLNSKERQMILDGVNSADKLNFVRRRTVYAKKTNSRGK